VPLRAAQPAPLVLGQGPHLAVVDGERVVVGQRHLDVVPHQQGQGLAVTRRDGDDLHGRCHQPVHHPVGHGHQDRRLAVEVPVDAGPDDAGLGADIRHGDRAEAAPRAQGRGGHQDPFLPVRVAPPRRPLRRPRRRFPRRTSPGRCRLRRHLASVASRR